jgi:hypothetical protein
MATPLPSPIADNNAIAALQIAADGSSTPYRPFTAASVALLQFQDSSKRQPHHRSGVTSRPNSPIKKHLNTRVSPLRRVTINDETLRAVVIDVARYGELHACIGLSLRSLRLKTSDIK